MRACAPPAFGRRIRTPRHATHAWLLTLARQPPWVRWDVRAQAHPFINIYENRSLLYSTKGKAVEAGAEQLAKQEMTGVEEVTFEMDLVLSGDIVVQVFRQSGHTAGFLLEQT